MSKPMLMVDAPAVDGLVTVAESIDAARDAAFAAATGEITTGRLQVDWDGGETGTRILVAAIPTLGVFGYKQFHWVGSGVHYSCHLFRTSDGAPLGVVDAAQVTTLRTAATAALGVERLYGRGQSAVVAVVGSGAEAKAGLRALVEVIDVIEARVTSRRVENRERFATEMSAELGIRVVPLATVAEAAAGADVVYSATQSNGAVVYHADDIRGVRVLATIGSTSPDQREASGDVFSGAATVVIDTMDALTESGDLIEATTGFAFDPGRAQLLGDALRSDATCSGDHDLAVFKSIGSPEQDLVLAHHILHRAHEAGLGRLVVPATSLKQNL